MNVKPIPGERFTVAPDWAAEENRAWQGAPGIARSKKGRLFVAFMSGGIYEPDPRNYVALVYSDDQGANWSQPIMTINSRPEQRIRAFEGEPWVDPAGRLWLFWAETPYPQGLPTPDYTQEMNMENDSAYHQLEAQVRTYAIRCDDPDAEELVFGEPVFLFPAVLRNHPFVCPNGRWIFSTYITSPRSYYDFYYSDDGGKNFRVARQEGRALRRAYDEPAFFLMPSGAIGAVVRTAEPCLHLLVSRDNGESWSPPVHLIDAASQRPCCHNLKNGKILLIVSEHPEKRNGLRVLLSEDGYHFRPVLVLDDRESVSYPDIAEDDAGTIYLTYDRERNNKIRKSWVTGKSEAAKEILFARITARALETGRMDADCVRALVISKARMDEMVNVLTAGLPGGAV